MCGIAGILQASGSPELPLIEKMTRTMTHRGPDGEGYYRSDNVALGHRRLSIIDLAGGKQPMHNEDQTVWITFNGEIYNFQQLRDDLESKGHKFSTNSDTEAIVHAWEEWSGESPKKLRGMFSYAVWDSNSKTLLAARDRLGKKPLYYYFNGKLLVFGSELKALMQHPHVPKDIDPAAIADYLTYHYIPYPRTIFKDIRKLPPATSLMARVKDDRIELKLEKYWDLKFDPDTGPSEADWIEAIREKLEEAVRIRLISDVPLGAFLSGGIDSSTVVALMSRIQSEPVKTFSIGFKEEDFSEVKYARQVSELFNTEHHEYVVEPDALDILPRLAWEFDEPFADSSAIPTYYVSKIARENVTVILSGDGGDEIFAGYRRYAWATDMRRYDFLPSPFKSLLFGVPGRLMPDGVKGKGTLLHLSRSPFERYAGLNTFGEEDYLDGLLTGDIKRELRNNHSGSLADYSPMRAAYDDCSNCDYLTRIQNIDINLYLAEDILTKVDRASMYCSLETRAPLLDHELIELCAKIPSTLKLKDGQTKYLLKRALENILPDNILYRKKMGFGVPLVHWFKKDITDYSHEMLLSDSSKSKFAFNPKYVEQLLETHKRSGRDLSARIWALLFFEHWCQNWI